MDNKSSVSLSTLLAFAPVGIIWAFLPVHLYSLGASYTIISLVSLIPAAETILFSPFWGGLLDNTGNGRRIGAIGEGGPERAVDNSRCARC